MPFNGIMRVSGLIFSVFRKALKTGGRAEFWGEKGGRRQGRNLGGKGGEQVRARRADRRNRIVFQWDSARRRFGFPEGAEGPSPGHALGEKERPLEEIKGAIMQEAIVSRRVRPR